MNTGVFAGSVTLSDDTDVLVRDVGRLINGCAIKTLLDIGAGDGLLAHRLAERVRQYVAIEPDLHHTRQLLDYGLSVVSETFPCPVPGTFEMVLISRVPQTGYAEAKRFLHRAWECVAPGGVLMAIMSHVDEHNDWFRLLRRLDLELNELPSSILGKAISTLPCRSLIARPITTRVRTTDVEALIEYLAWAASGGNQQVQRTVGQRLMHCPVLLSLYASEHGYEFPLTYSVREAHKGL